MYLSNTFENKTFYINIKEQMNSIENNWKEKEIDWTKDCISLLNQI